MPPADQMCKDISDIKVSIGKIECYMKNSKPALEQVWDNKDDITVIKTKQKLAQWIGGSAFTGIIIYIFRGYWLK